MTHHNPYTPPTAQIEHADVAAPSANTERLASGQRLMVLAMGLYLLGAVLRMPLGPVAALLVLAALIMGLVGVVRVGGGLGFGTGLRVLCFLLLFVPLVNLLVIVVLNRKATKRLRQHGYKVGLLGPRRS